MGIGVGQLDHVGCSCLAASPPPGAALLAARLGGVQLLVRRSSPSCRSGRGACLPRGMCDQVQECRPRPVGRQRLSPLFILLPPVYAGGCPFVAGVLPRGGCPARLALRRKTASHAPAAAGRLACASCRSCLTGIRTSSLSATLLHPYCLNFVTRLKARTNLYHHEKTYFYGSLGVVPFRLLQQ